MKYVIFPPAGSVQDTIYIPSSKSISNRMMIIRSLAGSDALLENLSSGDDTGVMDRALSETSPEKDVGHAGTAMRFLTAYYAVCREEVVLTGSPRLQERPMGPLVDALRALGAGIEYLGREGCPPLKITRRLTKGGKISVRGNISSQFISALMMIGPLLEGGLQLTLTGETVSVPYIRMTLELMSQCGVNATFTGNEIRIPRKDYRVENMRVEADWSAASYWYQVAALIPGSRLELPHLTAGSIQGDSVAADLFRPLGVESHAGQGKLTLVSVEKEKPGLFQHDFSGCPDLVQTLAATLCGLEVPFRFTGTRTLRIKETDRIAALQKELSQLGYVIEAGDDGEWISWDGTRCGREDRPVIGTYHDHRMAMSFAPLAIRFPEIAIEDPGVVTKSYPAYWGDLEKAGFRLVRA
ncbi:MAG: 3-phosphoshikimate 1-carboxyvinyltransferase [Bacteroidales bacterium]